MYCKIERQDETEIYISDRGHICLCQKDPIGNPDNVVTFTPYALEAIIGDLRAAIGEAGEIHTRVTREDQNPEE
jgi:hypothetical protein|tara:strand:- start:570 stop:791 length:222 start_codon:yes stop_codon:yes gene_type:complete